MTMADEVFEVIVALFAVACCGFFFWWARDVYRTNVAMDAAKARTENLGILIGKTSPREISEKFRAYVRQTDLPAGDHEILVLLASLYLLRRHLGLSCMFFAREIMVLPGALRHRVLDSSQHHIQQSDVKGLVHATDAPKIAVRIAERFEENIDDLKRELKARRLISPMHGTDGDPSKYARPVSQDG